MNKKNVLGYPCYWKDTQKMLKTYMMANLWQSFHKAIFRFGYNFRAVQLFFLNIRYNFSNVLSKQISLTEIHTKYYHKWSSEKQEIGQKVTCDGPRHIVAVIVLVLDRYELRLDFDTFELDLLFLSDVCCGFVCLRLVAVNFEVGFVRLEHVQNCSLLSSSFGSHRSDLKIVNFVGNELDKTLKNLFHCWGRSMQHKKLFSLLYKKFLLLLTR